jgi:eukaryotic-like serine/threonine-protein kinase
MSAVMTSDPEALEERRPAVPDSIATAVHRAIERVPADRFATAAQFAAALSMGREIITPRRHHAVAPPRRKLPLVIGGAALVAVAAAAGILAGRRLASAAPTPLRRWDIVLPDSAPVALAGAGSQPTIALAPAGDRLAYVAPRGSGTILMVRSLAGDSVTALAGTEGATRPFFSPDGQWVGFIAGGVLRKVPAAGGGVAALMEVTRVSGASWVAPDRILVFDNGGFDLHTVSASGAKADSTVHLTTQFGEPDALPGGEWVAGELSSGQLALLSLATGEELAITRRGVLPMDSVRQSDLLFGTSPRWLAAGYLVYAAGDGVLMAMPFDGVHRKVTGEPAPLVTGVRMEAGFGSGEFAIGHDGTLVYLPGRNQLYATFAFVSPGGRVDTLPLPRGPYTQPRLSPDGTQLAVQRRNPIGGWEVLLMDLSTGQTQALRQEGNYRTFPASWLPSGRELMIGLFDPVQFLNYGARIQSLETGQSTDIHLAGASYMTIAHDGESFVFSDWRTGQLYLRSLRGDTTRTKIPARGFAASFSPDGKWVAWGGVDGVGVSPVPPTGAVHRVAERGEMPLWTPKGDGLIYRDGSRYWRVPVTTAGGFRTGKPELLIEGSFLTTFAWNHDIAPDGRLLVMLTSPERRAGRLGVVTGFPAMMRGGKAR